MGVSTLRRGASLAFIVLLVSLCYTGTARQDGHQSAKVVGQGECVDCKEKNIKTSDAFTGLRVAIKCKVGDGKFKTKAVNKLDREGNFDVKLPTELISDEGQFKEECFAQLRSASNAPCPSPSETKLHLSSNVKGKQTYGIPGKLAFSQVTCASAFQVKPRPEFEQQLPLKIPTFKVPFAPLFPKFKFPFPPLVPGANTAKKTASPTIPEFEQKLPLKIPTFKVPFAPSFPKFKFPFPPFVPGAQKTVSPPLPEFEQKLPLKIPTFKVPFAPLFPKFKFPFPPVVPGAKKTASPTQP